MKGSQVDFTFQPKFHKFKVFIKTIKLRNFSAILKPCFDLSMSFKNCIRMRTAIFWRHAGDYTYYFICACLTLFPQLLTLWVQ